MIEYAKQNIKRKKIMTSYISKTEITLDKYMEMSNRPLGKKARNELKRWKMIKITCMVTSGVMAAVLTTMGEGFMAALAGTFCAVFIYQLFFQRKALLKKKYRQTVQAMNTDGWTRTIVFDEKISITDGNSTATFKYSDYKWAEENDKYFLIYRNEDVVLRVEKGSFTYGKEADFLRWISNKVK